MTKRTKANKTNQTPVIPDGCPLVNTAGVAAALGRTPKSIREMMDRKEIPGRKIGGRWGMHRDDLAALISPQQQEV